MRADNVVTWAGGCGAHALLDILEDLDTQDVFHGAALSD
jgi:hypothetical protein